ncbi:response regulator transcription factor [Clostridium ihumii]|uniref:response regulator transcription factor n=1 Tax=Clostridium ihumii TaxID=1470356 RepID=UPI00058E3BD7|nr:response regulator transcription factor [Clostridium ihumii]
MNYTILIAEDDNDIVKLLKLYLESSGYRVLTVDNGLSAFELIKNEQIDLAVVDIMMPKMDGYELIKKTREVKNIPILILSAKNQDTDKILGLNLGADDYMTKPFSPLEIIARVKANLRRFYNLNNGDSIVYKNAEIVIGELILNTEKLTLTKNGAEIIITPNEYKILALLMKSPGRVYTKSQICEAMNGELYDNYENVITVHISHLREKIESDSRNPRYIKNIRGLGYKIEE